MVYKESKEFGKLTHQAQQKGITVRIIHPEVESRLQAWKKQKLSRMTMDEAVEALQRALAAAKRGDMQTRMRETVRSHIEVCRAREYGKQAMESGEDRNNPWRVRQNRFYREAPFLTEGGQVRRTPKSQGQGGGERMTREWKGKGRIGEGSAGSVGEHTEEVVLATDISMKVGGTGEHTSGKEEGVSEQVRGSIDQVEGEKEANLEAWAKEFVGKL